MYCTVLYCTVLFVEFKEPYLSGGTPREGGAGKGGQDYAQHIHGRDRSRIEDCTPVKRERSSIYDASSVKAFISYSWFR